MNIDIEQIVREYITKTIHLSLATVSGDRPWVCEVHFVYDDNLNLYFRSTAARRHSQEIAANPQVAGNIVKQHEAGEYPHAIYFEGSASQVNDDEALLEVFQLFKTQQGLDESVLEDAKKDDGHKFYKISVENWYAFGKFGGDKGQKYQLVWNGGNK